MTLKFMLENLDDTEEATKTLYVKHDDGHFYLDVDGAVAKSKVDEFRDNNIGLKKDLEELNKKFEGVNLEEYESLRDKAALDDGKKRISMEKVDEIVAERTGAMKTAHSEELTGLNTQITTQGSQLNGLLIDSAVRDAAIAAGVKKGAISDVVLRAQSTFKVVEGKALAHDSDGKVIYGKNGTDPLTAGEWIGGLRTSADHLFEPNKGGGAGGGDNSGGGGGGNQQSREDMSPLQKIASGMKEE